MTPRGLCEICQTEVGWLHPKEVAALADVTPRTVTAWVDGGRVHVWELPNGRVLVCERSVEGAGRGRRRDGRGLRSKDRETAQGRPDGP